MATTKNAPSAEIAVRTSTDLAQLSELEEILLGNSAAPEVDDDPEAISREILQQLLGAESDAELEQAGTATGWRELLGLPVELLSFSWRPSTFYGKKGNEGGLPVFFIVRGTRLDTGEAVVLTTGSTNVCAQLTNMAKRGTLKGAVRMLVESDSETARGYRPCWLKTPPGFEKPSDATPGTDAA